MFRRAVRRGAIRWLGRRPWRVGGRQESVQEVPINLSSEQLEYGDLGSRQCA